MTTLPLVMNVRSSPLHHRTESLSPISEATVVFGAGEEIRITEEGEVRAFEDDAEELVDR